MIRRIFVAYLITTILLLSILTIWKLAQPSFQPSLPIPVSTVPTYPIVQYSVTPSSYTPSFPTLSSIFQRDHIWVATLSAEHIRTLMATGDVIPARSVNYQTIKNNNFHWAFDQTVDTLIKADITLANLETPLLASCPITNEGMLFCGSTKHIEGLLFADIDVANIANNHAGNHGIKGIGETTRLLEQNSIAVSGNNTVAIKEVNGLKFAFLGYNDIGAPEQGIAWADETKIAEEIKSARTISDVIVVSFHWGVEYVRQPNERQKQLGYLAIDSGADLVIGNHPHWIQPVELYKGKLITYAHGNLVFDQMWSEETKYGVIGKYTFYDNQLIDAEYLPIYIKDFGQPSFLERPAQDKVIEMIYQESLKLQ